MDEDEKVTLDITVNGSETFIDIVKDDESFGLKYGANGYIDSSYGLYWDVEDVKNLLTFLGIKYFERIRTNN